MKRLFLVVLFVFIGVGIAIAAPAKEHVFELGTDIYYHVYKEPDIMENKGMMYGVIGSYAYHKDIMFKVDGRFAYGPVDYSSTLTGTMDKVDDYVIETRGLLGYDYKADDTFTITPYIGFGYRYLNDDSSDKTTSTGALGYERESNYYYSPVGLELAKRLDGGWSIGAIFEYDIFWQGQQKSKLSGAVASFSDIKNDQDEGYGVRGSVKIAKETEKLNIILEPFVRYWNVKQSKSSDLTYNGVIIGYGYEPKNNTTEYGADLSVQF
ncbi:MAG: autotransporter outer membrane beta-barrel domain-containing protein [Candidatus Omnitrophica bacterium]|nr:autotransporter outer membrane beta-barrel domain-containing protein [Candidatus Omnitrophota bacterium]